MSIMSSCLPFGLVCTVAEANGMARPCPRMTSSAAAQPPGEREAVDARLMQQVAQGDKQAFAELYDRFSGPLFGTALRVVRDPGEAQDIVHDAFVAVWEKAGTFENSRGTAFSWFVTLVRNRAIDRVRMRRRRAELLADSFPADLGYAPEAEAPAGDDAAAMGDDARVVRDAVATLPPEQQRALQMAFFGGLTQEQIAGQLNEPLGTVKARIRRGLLKLRESLAHRL
jgi:RNA polymerase sigma-70 factor (ECF subfamily)